MTIKAKLPSNHKEFMQKFREIAPVAEKLFISYGKADATAFIKKFQSILKTNSEGLEKLSKFTVDVKREDGLPRPTKPLFGKGDELPNTLYNAHYIRPFASGKSKGYEVALKDVFHHMETTRSKKAKPIMLSHLMAIHERGCVIRVTEKQRWFMGLAYGLWFKRTTSQIRIPARPARKKAYDAVMAKKQAEWDRRKKQIASALLNYMKGKTQYVENIIQRNMKDEGFEKRN